MFIPPGPRLGDIVVRADGVAKAYGENLLYDNLSFELPPGAIVGIIGPNGAGKTTLFRMIIGQEQPDSGTLRVGETVQLAYVDQSRASLNAEKSVDVYKRQVMLRHIAYVLRIHLWSMSSSDRAYAKSVLAFGSVEKNIALPPA